MRKKNEDRTNKQITVDVYDDQYNDMKKIKTVAKIKPTTVIKDALDKEIKLLKKKHNIE